MNDLTRDLIRRTWAAVHGTSAAKTFQRFEREVQARYWAHVHGTVGTQISERAVRLARVFWTHPECFDPDDPCDNCSIRLADALGSNYSSWWIGRHPEWQLDPFTEADMAELVGCTHEHKERNRPQRRHGLRARSFERRRRPRRETARQAALPGM